MDHDDYSRREFLKRFAALSSASLLLGMTGCGDVIPPASTYGPAPLIPVPAPRVSSIYFREALLGNVVLSGHQDVPVTTTFIIHFTTTMDTTAPITVALHDDTNNNAVALDAPVWGGDYMATVAPSAALLNSTDYTLSVTDATSSNGKQLIIDANASASFRTS